MTWDNDFEATPSDLTQVLHGDDRLRELKVKIRERMELEHNFVAGVSPYHKKGQCSVLFVGDTNAINNLKGVTKGCVAYNTLLNAIVYYDGSNWVGASNKHGEYTGLDEDNHPQYFHLSKLDQELKESLIIAEGKKIGGKLLGVEGRKLDTYIKFKTSLAKLTFFSTLKEIHTDGTFDGITIGQIIRSTTPVNVAKRYRVTFISTDKKRLVVDGQTPIAEGPIEGVIYSERRGMEMSSTVYAAGTEYKEVTDCFICVSAKTDTTNIGTISIHRGNFRYSLGELYPYVKLRLRGVQIYVKAGVPWKVVTTASAVYISVIRIY